MTMLVEMVVLIPVGLALGVPMGVALPEIADEYGTGIMFLVALVWLVVAFAIIIGLAYGLSALGAFG